MRPFSRRTRRTLGAIAEALFGAPGAPPPASRIEWLVDDLEDFCRGAGARSRLMVRLLVLGIAVVGPFFARRPRLFRRLSLETRIRALDRMESSFASALVLGLKAMLCILYYEHPDAAHEVGFDGACLVEAGS